jgi:hypothetical protein
MNLVMKLRILNIYYLLMKIKFYVHVIKQLMDNRTLTFYTRYVDDIFLNFDTIKKNPDDILQHIRNNIQLNPTHESDNGN